MTTQLRETVKDLSELEQLIQRAGEGSQEAKLELFQKYARHLLTVIQHKLKSARRVRSIYDSDDFVQDVGKVFFSKDLPQGIFESPGTFIAFLTTVAKNRVTDVARKHLHAKKSDMNREVPLAEHGESNDKGLLCQHPSPLAVCDLKEEWDRVSEGLPPDEIYILYLLDHGRTHEEVARILDISERTVDRFVAKLKKKARRLQ
jgi:RNA polymerase sigma factor (sigma-70 family)